MQNTWACRTTEDGYKMLFLGPYRRVCNDTMGRWRLQIGSVMLEAWWNDGNRHYVYCLDLNYGKKRFPNNVNLLSINVRY